MARRKVSQLALDLERRAWGGRREGAGRKAGPRPATPHRARSPHYHGHPVHITLRARRGPYLRAEQAFRRVRDAIRDTSREAFRIVHFSVQGDHLHLIAEAPNARALSSGARGLAIRIAKRMNGWLRRRGPLWGDRWHGRALKTPREVRNALVYVLANYKKHVRELVGPVDPCSSAPWFDGFSDVSRARLDALARGVAPPVRAPRTWLGAVAWRRRGLVSAREAPASS